jgi:hypothetical protein
MTAKSVNNLLLDYFDGEIQCNSSKIKFHGIEKGKDVYNITAPFKVGEDFYLAGRTEPRDSEYSEVVFFKLEGAAWVADHKQPRLKLQDPFVSKIDHELVLGGVEVFDDTENPGVLNYRTVFYRGTSINALQRFTQGPDHMKDIRLCELPDGRILVMTRPQGENGGRGKIGYLIIDSLDELNAENIEKAVILEDMFLPEEWGGCNELHLLKNGKIGILSHIAKYGQEGNRHYYATVFCFDYRTGQHTPMKIIATRKNFQDGPSKRDDLKDVIFSGGIVRMENGMAQLYCGVSDVEGHTITIADPFVSFEQ